MMSKDALKNDWDAEVYEKGFFSEFSASGYDADLVNSQLFSVRCPVPPFRVLSGPWNSSSRIVFTARRLFLSHNTSFRGIQEIEQRI